MWEILRHSQPEESVQEWGYRRSDDLVKALDKVRREIVLRYTKLYKENPPSYVLPECRVLSEMPICTGLQKFKAPRGFSGLWGSVWHTATEHEAMPHYYFYNKYTDEVVCPTFGQFAPGEDIPGVRIAWCQAYLPGAITLLPSGVAILHATRDAITQAFGWEYRGTNVLYT